MNIDGSKKKSFYLKQVRYFCFTKTYDLLPDEPNYVMVAINDRRGSVEDYYRLNIFTGAERRGQPILIMKKLYLTLLRKMMVHLLLQ